MLKVRFDNRSKWLLPLIVPIALFPGTSDAVCLRINSYDDCLIEGLKGTTSDIAAQAIKRACTEKFPGKAKKTLRLSSQSAMERISGTAGYDGFGSLSGSLYNGSPFHVTGATLSIRPKVTESGEKNQVRLLAIELNAPQNSTGIFCIFIDGAFANAIRNGFDWSVTDISVLKEE